VNTRSSIRYFLASIVLLVAVVAVYAASSARRTQGELRAQLEQQGQALATALETGSRNAIRSNALIEEMIAQRLLDNARLVDELVRRPLDPDELRRIAERNRLRRVDLLDPDGRPWTPPAPPRGMMMGPPMMRAPGPGRGAEGGPPAGAPMMSYMWGRRWGRPGEEAAGAQAAPPAIRDRKFWEGSVFGVAIGATSFKGIVAVHADADYILNFRREIGVERQLEELGRQEGVRSVALLGPDLTVLAHSDATRVGGRRDEPALADALAARRTVSRFADAGGARVLEVVRPIALDGARQGLLAVDFSTEPMERAWRRDLRAGVGLALAALAVGALGLGLIFWVQRRHLGEVRALETEMARRERLAALGDVAAAFAHEVRNPLNAVSMGLQRLGAEFKPEPAGEYARFVELMQGEVRRLNAIVEQFIALARPLPLKPAPVEPDELLRELAALVEGEARQAGVALRLVLPAALPTLVADRDHLKQVLLNLARNAVQAMAQGGTLTLSAEAARGSVAIAVADTGPGIAPAALPRVFDPYFTTKPGGLGLGLTIARRIVEAHGGALTAESEPGRGSVFRVSLPLARA
jgi:signal transduction histidine kinase